MDNINVALTFARQSNQSCTVVATNSIDVASAFAGQSRKSNTTATITTEKRVYNNNFL